MFLRDCFVSLLAIALCPMAARASLLTTNFDNFADSTILTGQLPGITFGNAVVLTAGVSLNEFEFPPHSGKNVVSDYGGPLSIFFAAPVSVVDGYFTYADPLSLEAFSSSGQLLASTTSRYSDNEALSGVPESTPNELIGVNALGISRVVIEGDPYGGSFTLDDLSYGTTNSAVPEPNELVPCVLLLLGSTAFSLRRRTDLYRSRRRI